MVGVAISLCLVVTLGCLVRPGPWLCAVPAALGALQLPATDVTWPRAGPIALDATVTRVVRRDVREQATVVQLRQRERDVLGIVRGSARVLPGDRLTGVGRFVPAEARERPRRPRIATDIDAVVCRPERISVPRWTAHARNVLEDAMAAHTGGRVGALLSHLVLGRGPALDDDLVAAHRATGLAHLLAVSGAHASLLAWMLGIAFALTGRRDPFGARGYRWFCGAFLMLYGAVTGFDPPMFRALVAFALVLATTAAGRTPSVTAALALPALLTALLVPDDLGSVSFALSYAAVIGLGLAGAFRPDGFFASGRWTAPFRASFWAALLTAPLTLHYFGQLAPWTIVATPLLSPLVACMLGFGILAVLLDAVATPIAHATATIATWCGEVYVRGVELCAALPGSPIFASSNPPAGGFVGVGLLAALWILLRPRRSSVAGACLLFCLPHFVPWPVAPDTLRLLAVGHGLAAVATTENAETIVIDCGSIGDARRAAVAVERALEERRVIDVLIVSHDDFDHAGGVPELCRRVRVRRAILPEHARGTPVDAALTFHGTPIHWLQPGRSTNPSGGVFVSAPAIETDDDNERSLWVELGVDGTTCVFPGDADEEGIRWWLSARPRGADVLVLPHHGRGDERSVRRLLDRVRPRMCWISNRDGESSTALGTLAARVMSVPVLHTGSRGTITLRIGRVDTERGEPLHSLHALEMGDDSARRGHRGVDMARDGERGNIDSRGHGGQHARDRR